MEPNLVQPWDRIDYGKNTLNERPKRSKFLTTANLSSITLDDLCLTNQIYSALLNAFEFKEITEVQNAHLQMLLEDDET